MGLKNVCLKICMRLGATKQKPVDDYRKRNVSEKNLDIGISCKWVT